MNFLRHLTFVWTPWSLTASIVGVVITAGYCFLAWQQSGYRRSQGLLEGLRLLIVCLAALLFNQPEWVEEYRPEEKPTVAVLWDASSSMETRDVVAAGRPGSQPITRHESIAPLIDAAAWKNLEGRLNVVIQPFLPPQAVPRPHLFAPLAD